VGNSGRRRNVIVALVRHGEPNLARGYYDDCRRRSALVCGDDLFSMNQRTYLGFVRGAVIAGTIFILIGLTAGFAQTARPDAAQPTPVAAADRVFTLDAGQVTGTALRSQEAVNNRRIALAVADTLTQDDIGALADENLADALIRIPGVSTMQTLYGEQEASYVSTRGISPDLNFVSFDGIAMFSTASDGDGLRRVDLNLIPT